MQPSWVRKFAVDSLLRNRTKEKCSRNFEVVNDAQRRRRPRPLEIPQNQRLADLPGADLRLPQTLRDTGVEGSAGSFVRSI